MHTYIHIHAYTYTGRAVLLQPHCGGLFGASEPDTYIHTYIHTYMHTYIHEYIHTYIHTHIHTQAGQFYYNLTVVDSSGPQNQTVPVFFSVKSKGMQVTTEKCTF
jgi:hypothetical protein